MKPHTFFSIATLLATTAFAVPVSAGPSIGGLQQGAVGMQDFHHDSGDAGMQDFHHNAGTQAIGPKPEDPAMGSDEAGMQDFHRNGKKQGLGFKKAKSSDNAGMQDFHRSADAVGMQDMHHDADNGKTDSIDEVSENEQLRLQQANDRRSKFMSTLSNVNKKTSETSGNITNNMK